MTEQVVDEMLEYLKTKKPGLLTTLIKIAECRTYDTSYPPRKLLHRDRLITEADVLAKLTEFGAAVYEAHTGNPAANVYKPPAAEIATLKERIRLLQAENARLRVALAPFAVKSTEAERERYVTMSVDAADLKRAADALIPR